MYFLLWGNCHAGRRMCLLFSCQTYGPVHLFIVCGEVGYQTLSIWWAIWKKLIRLVLITERASLSRPFFDQESRGFHLHKSHLSDPDRLMCLMMAACLVYIRSSTWESSLAMRLDGSRIIHRSNRCDLSLFQLGLRLLSHFLNERCPNPRGLFPGVMADHVKVSGREFPPQNIYRKGYDLWKLSL